jgi:DNA-binding CsgD family transcriptional regulator
MAGLDAEQAAAIVDRVYEAAFVPDGWPKALEQISDMSGSAAGTIFLFGDDLPVRGRCQPVLQPLVDEFVAGDAWKRSDSFQRVHALKPASFVVIDDLMTAAEKEQDPEFIRSRAIGIGTTVCTAVPMPTGDLVLFGFLRWLKDGTCDPASLDLLNGFRPHLARAGLITARLRLEQAQATVSALKAIGLPAAVIGASGKVLATNDLVEDMADVLLPAAFSRMAVADPAADLLFQEAVAQNRQHGVVRSIPVRRGEGRPAIVLHVVPLRRAALDIFSGGDILVAATVPTASAMVPAANVLTSLFDLTPAEARLATELASGLSLGQAAGRAGVSVGTARNYLMRIFRKTGTSQQSQLVALLKTVHPFQG